MLFPALVEEVVAVGAVVTTVLLLFVAILLLLGLADVAVCAETAAVDVTGIAGALVLLLAVKLIFTLVPTRLGFDTMARAGFLSSDLPGWPTVELLPVSVVEVVEAAPDGLVAGAALLLLRKLAAMVKSS